MAERSAIEWCDATFNPWIGCTKVSPGCDNCYAEQQDKFRSWTPAGWGAGQPRKRTAPSTWREPAKWNARPFYECDDCGWRGETDSNCPRCGEEVHTARRRVFCASLADVFDNEVPDEWRADIFRLILDTPNLDWLLLTKRIGNAAGMMFHAIGRHAKDETPWVLPNVWLGATVVNQEEADRDIPKLLATPARVRFLSMEPLLGDVDLSQWLFPFRPCKDCPCPDPDTSREGLDRCCKDPELLPSQLNWIITGGESGPKARPSHPDWFRSLRDQCAAAGVPFLFKQWGEHAPTQRTMADVAASNRKLVGVQRDPGQRFPIGLVDRVGKKAAGRLLDGVEHNGFPEVAS